MIEEILKSINIVYLIAFLVSFIFTFILIKLLVYNAKGLKLIDYPDTRKTHEKGIPLVGGIAIFLPFIFFAFPIGFPIFIEPFINSQSLCLFLSVFIIFMVGLCDDIIGLSAYKKMLFQFLSSFLLIYGFGTTLVFILPLSILDWGIGYYTYIILNILVLICFIMGVTNSINLVDGIDGLAGGLSIIISITFIVLNIIIGLQIEQLPLFILLGSLVAFMIYNRDPAKIFLGDSGSLFLGWVFTLISLSYIMKSNSIGSVIYASMSMVKFSILLPLLIIGIPAFDVLFVMLKRFLSTKDSSILGRIKRIFTADNFHTHHLFLSYGLSKKKTVVILYMLNIILSVLSISLYFYIGEGSLVYLLVISFILIFCIRYSLSNNVH